MQILCHYVIQKIAKSKKIESNTTKKHFITKLNATKHLFLWLQSLSLHNTQYKWLYLSQYNKD